MEEYLLFVEEKEYPADHDLLVSDFVNYFLTASDAMDYYDSHYSSNGIRHPALVALFSRRGLSILHRTVGDSTLDHEFRPGWTDTW